MNAENQRERSSIAVVGGGIAGLAAAHRIAELASQCSLRLYEAAPCLGGVLQTDRRDGYLIERASDMFITRDPWAVDLCRRIGFADQLIPTNSAGRGALVLSRGRLYPIPEGFTLLAPARVWPMLRTPILSWRGKLRLAAEYFVPPRQTNDDESVAQFVTRRFGREAFERLVQPLVGGIYTADSEKLSVAATMPQFPAMEREHRSLIRALRKTAPSMDDQHERGARYGAFVTPRDGMASLVQAVAARLPSDCVVTSCPLTGLTRQHDGRWRLTFERRPAETTDAVILATPASHAAAWIGPLSPQLQTELAAIEYADSAVVALGIARRQLARPLNTFGIVIPEVEGRRVLAISCASNKFPGRAPEGEMLLRVFVGGACHPEWAQLDDQRLMQLVQEELRDLVGLVDAPRFAVIHRWPRTMPQYHVGHRARLQRIAHLLADLPGLYLAGSSYDGVGIPFCIHSGERAAEAALAATTGSNHEGQ